MNIINAASQATTIIINTVYSTSTTIAKCVFDVANVIVSNVPKLPK